jgi:NADH-quinone oxidoreductase subunit C
VTDKKVLLQNSLQHVFPQHDALVSHRDMLEMTVSRAQLLDVCQILKFEKGLLFNQLIDLCVVDYLHYGKGEWQTEAATETGYSRAKHPMSDVCPLPHRYAVVYHFLSLTHNWRLRVRVWLDETDISLPSLCAIWPCANWYEREAFDLYGVFFDNHPDLRRILTDYGFVGHPFRKDFPLEGHVEMRYDATAGKCIYEPVAISNRVVVPKVVRHHPQPSIHEDK